MHSMLPLAKGHESNNRIELFGRQGVPIGREVGAGGGCGGLLQYYGHPQTLL